MVYCKIARRGTVGPWKLTNILVAISKHPPQTSHTHPSTPLNPIVLLSLSVMGDGPCEGQEGGRGVGRSVGRSGEKEGRKEEGRKEGRRRRSGRKMEAEGDAHANKNGVVGVAWLGCGENE